MYNQFQVTATISTLSERGEEQSKTQNYIICAYTFTEAENVTHTIVGSNLLGITAIKRSTYDYVFDSNDKALFFAIDIQETSISDASGREQKVKTKALVAADDIEEAKQLFLQHYEMLPSTTILSIKQTNINEYIPLQK